MIIKKDNNSNDYLLTSYGNTWVRNFTKKVVREIDINKLVTSKDYRLILQNEAKNNSYTMPLIDTETFFFPKVAIISDGYGFEETQNIIAELPSDVAVFATNGVLAKWKLLGNNPIKRNITFYIANNPYQESLSFLPRKHRYYPKCIASVRTNCKFLELYHGNKYRYTPVTQEDFGPGLTPARWLIDDYRNPIVAAISLAFKMEAYKIMLFSCDDAYDKDNPGSSKVAEQLWQYPAQIHAKSIVDSHAYWLTTYTDRPTQISVYSPNNIVYEYVPYIKTKEEVVEFFNND